jgi:hypothetical protein
LLALKAFVEASKDIICADMKVMTIWISHNINSVNKSIGSVLATDVYAVAGAQVLNLEESKVLKFPSFSMHYNLNLGILFLLASFLLLRCNLNQRS